MISLLQKNISVILIGITIGMFFAPLAFETPKAHALFFAFSFEVNPITWFFQILDNVKEYIGDGVAYALVTIIAGQLMNSVVKWAATGEWNAPLFVTDWRGFAINAADVTLTEFDTYMKTQGLPSICTPFQNFIQLNIDLNLGNNPHNVTTQQKLTCTFDQLKNNATAFANYVENFEEGGWEMFINLNTESNNPFGIYLETIDAQGKAVALGGKARLNQALSGGGWLGATNQKGGNIKSPGDYVSNLIKQKANLPTNHLGQADELTEVVLGGLTGVINGLIGRALR